MDCGRPARNGRVLVVGGYRDGASQLAAYLWDPGTRTWSAARSLPAPRFAATVATLPSGSVLVAGRGSSLSAGQPQSYLWSASDSDGIGTFRGHHAPATPRNPVTPIHRAAVSAAAPTGVPWWLVTVSIVGAVVLLGAGVIVCARRRRRTA